MHPSMYSPHDDYTGWYAAEKREGVRAIWTGTTFVSRTGKEFKNVPKTHFNDKLPRHIKLDGDFWYVFPKVTFYL